MLPVVASCQNASRVGSYKEYIVDESFTKEGRKSVTDCSILVVTTKDF